MKNSEAMGGRFWLGVLILLGLLSISIFESLRVEQIHSEMSEDLEKAATMAVADDMDGAVQQAKKVWENWVKNWKWTASSADQTPMDTIDSLFHQLRAYETSDMAEEFAACCYQLSALIRSFADAHRATWWNIL